MQTHCHGCSNLESRAPPAGPDWKKKTLESYHFYLCYCLLIKIVITSDLHMKDNHFLMMTSYCNGSEIIKKTICWVSLLNLQSLFGGGWKVLFSRIFMFYNEMLFHLLVTINTTTLWVVNGALVSVQFHSDHREELHHVLCTGHNQTNGKSSFIF